MLRLTKFFARTLSFRLSLRVLVALATLLMVALFIMFRYSRKAVKDEALQKAGQTLEATVQNIDNILLSVEQSAGNIYWKVVSHIDEPEMMEVYRRKLVETNPYISSCVIAFDPDFYQDSENHPYHKESWFIHTMATGTPCWMEPQQGAVKEDDAVVSFCLPIYARERKVGAMSANVSRALLSKVVLETKPSPNSFSTLLSQNGSFIVYPDTSQVMYQKVFSQIGTGTDPSVEETASAMMAGETGYKHVRVEGEDFYVFYKPFERSVVPGRSVEKLGWSVGVVYPENDIFGDYNRLLYTVLLLAVVGLILLLVLCQTFIHRQLLPLRLLSKTAQRISEGYYEDPIPDSRQQDEVGRLQKHFQQMQKSLSSHVDEMNRLTMTLRERGEELQETYEQAQEADRMKTNFLYNMTNQMTSPVSVIFSNVKTINTHYSDLTEEVTGMLVDEIQHQGEKITSLLNQLIADSEKNITKTEPDA